MSAVFTFGEEGLSIEPIKDFVFKRRTFDSVELSPALRARIEASHRELFALLEKRIPVYGVTTGFGDSSHRFIAPENAEALQRNLIAYLGCGTGPALPELASRATVLIRTNSLSRGYSGVSTALLERLILYMTNGWTPVTPREGSLGASGDLIPLTYLAAAVQGYGQFYTLNGTVSVDETLKSKQLSPYTLRPKEGLALVNGTSGMAGLALLNLTYAHSLLNFAVLSTAWMTMAMRSRTEPFSILVNEQAQTHAGQTRVAKAIRMIHASESYTAPDLKDGPVQDRYSIRCAPQVLGPIVETIELGWKWLAEEINAVSDNPLIASDGTVANGGNFYGGYLAHSQDYLKICVANMADLLDRQLMLLMDERQNNGLPANLVAENELPHSQKFLHHGLKALHQAVSALTSEIMAKAIPNSIFSRSSESHNQDKVSLGMSAAVQCHEMLEQMFSLQAMVLICLAQAIDLREIRFTDFLSKDVYQRIRNTTPFVRRDTPLGDNVKLLAEELKRVSTDKGEKLISL